MWDTHTGATGDGGGEGGTARPLSYQEILSLRRILDGLLRDEWEQVTEGKWDGASVAEFGRVSAQADAAADSTYHFLLGSGWMKAL